MHSGNQSSDVEMTSCLEGFASGGQLSVLLVDDRIVVREGLATLLGKQPDLRVVGQLPRPEKQGQLDVEPDVIVTEIELGQVGEETTVIARLRSAFPSSAILVLTNNAHPATIEATLGDGADGYLLKTATADEFLSAIRAVGSGDTYLQPSLGVVLARWRRPRPERLSQREEEVLVLVATGHTNAGIAEQFSTGLRTVETQRARLMQKLGRKTRSELFEYALAAGLINPPP